MDLLIMRHAEAEPLEHSATQLDWDRVLTTRGKRRTHAAANALRNMSIPLQLVATSPLTRACQTAQTIVSTWDGLHIKILDSLQPGFAVETVIAELGRLSETIDHLLVIGHEPQLSALTTVLIGASEAVSIRLKKGAICRLHWPAPHDKHNATLLWLLTAKHLVGLERSAPNQNASSVRGTRGQKKKNDDPDS